MRRELAAAHGALVLGAVSGALAHAAAITPALAYPSWNGIMAPAGTPREIIARLHDEIARRVLSGEQREQLIKEGYEIAGLGPEAFAAYLKAETVKWAKVIKAANVKAE